LQIQPAQGLRRVDVQHLLTRVPRQEQIHQLVPSILGNIAKNIRIQVFSCGGAKKGIEKLDLASFKCRIQCFSTDPFFVPQHARTQGTVNNNKIRLNHSFQYW
jgi:hypothetical protein